MLQCRALRLPMSIDTFLILLTLIVGFGALALLLRKWITGTTAQKPDQLFSDLIRSFDTRSTEQSKEIREQTRSLNERLDNAARVISAVQKNIGEFSEIGRSMKDLQNFLKSPKLRGNIGEEVLSDLIGQMFPKHSFYLQHSFKSGARVDAAIKTDAGILPIDAKFPLENYQKMVTEAAEADREIARREFVRNVKGHIETISQKYILPDEGTLDFALMYVPSEGVYYELVGISEIMSFAKKHRVYPVSPTTLYAHLQTILLSFTGKQIENKTKHVFKLLRSISNDYEKLISNVGVLGKHVTNAYNQMNNVNQGINLLGQKIESVNTIQDESEKLTDLEQIPAQKVLL